jgi:parallel beta-helix repeat protein
MKVGGATGVANDGLFILSPNNTIGGLTPADRNLISGNYYGVYISGTFTSGNLVEGNYIGTDVSGKQPLANDYGVYLAGPGNSVGGTTAAARNLISANGTGVSFSDDHNNVVQGNYIGTDVTGTKALGNGTGVSIFNGINNTLGGATSGARNVIAGSTGAGVDISGQQGSLAGLVVQGNYVGTDATGTVALGNQRGVAVNAPNVTIGGTAPGAGNLISGNMTRGVFIQAPNALIQGNTIGTNAAGSLALGNQTGVSIGAFGSNATIGGTAAGAGNLISGNSANGIEVNANNATGNLIQGNRIGTDASGAKAVGNAVGVAISNSSTLNTIGGLTAAARNVISGNHNVGIDLAAVGGNLVEGNYVGTDAAGSKALSDAIGVFAESGAHDNTIGGTAAGAGNVVSGNNYGIYLSFSNNNLVQGNYVGTDSTGTMPLGNGLQGVEVAGTGNTGGGAAAGAGNVVSASGGSGVFLYAAGTQNNVVQGNKIGTDVTGTLAPLSLRNREGVDIDSGTGPNTVGGTAAGAGNLISGNFVGVLLAGNGSLVQGNLIGTDAGGTKALANNTGVSVTGTNNTVGGAAAGAGNLISGNGNGVVLATGGNVVQGNRIGSDSTGTKALGNGSGVQLNSSNNTLGGTALGAGNLISGTATGNGVFVGGNANLIQGNRIGTDATGTKALGNVTNLFVLASNNTVGGTAAGAGNLISGGSSGVVVSGSNNLVQGNFVGTDVTGTKALGNSLQGVGVSGSGNTVGGTAPGAGNLISANSLGVLVDGTGELVQGNLIGTDVSGTAALGNGTGVEINSSNNTVGGTTAAARNVISGSVTGNAIGVYFAQPGGSLVEGNFIGTDVTGTKALGNNTGVSVFFSNNTIGGTAAGAGNLISGNHTVGIVDKGTGTLIQGNLIGTDVSGAVALGNPTGVSLQGAGATVGGSADGARNVISGSFITGVSIGAGTGQRVQGNYIGTDATGTKALGNGTGVLVNTSGAQVVGNLISGNLADGVSLSSGSNNLVQGNTIGADVSGTNALGNIRGVLVRSAGNTVGGTAAGAGNTISGNHSNALEVDAGSTLVQGNRIGTDATGSFAVPNNGVGVALAGDANTVGGSAAGAGNVLSANVAGVEVFSGSGNLFQGNRVGTDAAGTAALPNVFGLWIVAGSGNTIGGAAPGAGNLVSGNSSNGIFLSSAGNLVQGNLIGTDAAGSAAVANTRGVQVSSANNTIGGNLISGNGTGVVLSAGGNLLQGNTLGTDAGAAYAVGNDAGVVINSTGNMIGGTAPGAGNLISGNGTGVQVASPGNLIQGNLIGTDGTGSAALGNATGVSITAANNTLGGTAPGASNVISGNGTGVALSGSGAANNVVQGNLIGTDAGGANPVGNAEDGIFLTSGANHNLIGGAAPGAGNVIAASGAYGVALFMGSGSNQVQGNLIGTDAGGTAPLGNLIGVFVGAGSNDNTVGGTAAGAGNLISASLSDGIYLNASSRTVVRGNTVGADVSGTNPLGNRNGITVVGSDATTLAGNLLSGNREAGVYLSDATNLTIAGNLIGTDASGTQALGNGGAGIFLLSGSNVTVGGTASGAGNLISANGADGITISGPSTTGVVVQGNTIGADVTGAAFLGNGGNGVALVDGAHDNRIGGVALGAGNLIAFNGNDGVLVDGGAGNAILHDRIFANANLGIELLDGGNNGQPAPTVTSVVSGGGQTNVQVDFSGLPSTVYTLELFVNSDPASDQGERFLGSFTVLTDPSGVASFTASFGFDLPAGEVVTATLTDPFGNTSTFSLATPVNG